MKFLLLVFMDINRNEELWSDPIEQRAFCKLIRPNQDYWAFRPIFKTCGVGADI